MPYLLNSKQQLYNKTKKENIEITKEKFLSWLF